MGISGCGDYDTWTEDVKCTGGAVWYNPVMQKRLQDAVELARAETCGIFSNASE
jgi:hypothetical protein